MVGTQDKLNVEIVENKNEVLPIVIRNIGTNFKSGEDVVLIRFDSFADFLVPKNLPADEIERLDRLVDAIDNQSWILPAAYRGYISKIIWFKPPWAHQFQDGKYQIQVGKCQQTGVLKIASTIPYFTSNCVYSSSEKLSNIHTVDIYICTAGLAHTYSSTTEKSDAPIYDNDSGSESLDADNRKKMKLSTTETNHKDATTKKRLYPLDVNVVEQLLESRTFLLDIDVSFFSTDDSIRKQFDENEYEILRFVYARVVHETNEEEILRYITAREQTLEQIRSYMEEYLVDPKPDQQIVTENPYLSALIGIIRYKKLDWKSVHNYGMHLADTRPPLHVSSEEMVIYLLEATSKILQSIKQTPMLITISRSVHDGYCSAEQADLIQKYLEKKLRKLYKIDQTNGKSLFTPDDEEEEEEEIEHEEEVEPTSGKEQKQIISNDDENSRLSGTNRSSGEPEIPLSSDTSNVQKNKPSVVNDSTKGATTLSPATNENNANNSPSSPAAQVKNNLSPGEISKAISPSSLSEASPL